jgi:hypothetical protein
VIHLGLAIKHSVCDTNYWIIIPVGIGIQVTTERVRYEHLLLVLNVQYKLLFDQALF